MKGTCKHLASFEKKRPEILDTRWLSSQPLPKQTQDEDTITLLWSEKMTDLGPSPLGWLP